MCKAHGKCISYYSQFCSGIPNSSLPQVLTDNVNLMASNWTNQTRSIAEVAKAITIGDLSKKIEVDAQGEFLDLKFTLNHMTESLNLYATEMTRVAREVGTHGMFGQPVRVANLGGAWKDLTDNVDVLIMLLTNLARATAHVTVSDHRIFWFLGC